MKKLFLLLLLSSLFVSTTGFAQERARSGFGIRAGINAANLVTNGDTDFSFNYGPMGGIYYRLGLFPNLTIQPELLYSQQGAEFDVPAIPNARVNDRLHYLNLPVLFQFWLSDGLNIHIGPYGGVLLDVYSEGRNNVSADYRRWDYGGAAGIEYEFPFGLNFGGRYNLGFTDIAGDNHNTITVGPGPAIEGRNTNQFIQVYLGWTF